MEKKRKIDFFAARNKLMNYFKKYHHPEEIGGDILGLSALFMLIAIVLKCFKYYIKSYIIRMYERNKNDETISYNRKTMK